MADCQGEQCDSGDDDGECGILTSVCGVLLFVYILGFWVFSEVSLCWIFPRLDLTLSARLSSIREVCIAQCLIVVFFPLICGAVWPVLVLFWLLYRVSCDVYNCVVYTLEIPTRRAERVARQRLQAAIDYLRRCRPETKWRWLRRGWLVMLRARHQAFLEQERQAPLTSRLWLLCGRRANDLCGITLATMENNPLCTAGGEAAASARVTDVELEQCEEGVSDLEFARAVVSVVGIVEEGLFRHIIMYL